jgi:glutamine amidotransferase
VSGPQVHVVDLGANNLASVTHALARVGANAAIARTPDDILAADRLILPGVGSAAHVASRLSSHHLDEALTEAVRKRGKPLLAICLGMQFLVERLTEHGTHAGLGWLPGESLPLRDLVGSGVRVPHMGWTPLRIAEGAADNFGRPRGTPNYFFCHSFAVVTPAKEAVAASVDLGVDVVAALRFDTVFGTQFHPERSHLNGQRLIETFLDWRP